MRTASKLMEASGLALWVLVLAGTATADDRERYQVLRPLMTVPDRVVLKSDFSKTVALSRNKWNRRQGTRWTIADGVLKGEPSTPQYQASKTHHRGLEPRLNVPITPREFAAEFSVRFLDGMETRVVPFVEFGHHVCRLKFHKEGVSLLADSESLKLSEVQEVKYKPGRWYRCFAEMKDNEFVIQFADGPTLYAKHPRFRQPPPSGGAGLGFAGPRGGRVEIDNVTIWKVRSKPRPDWPERRAALTQFKPVPTQEPAVKRDDKPKEPARP